jgi:hypothetical protein
MLLTNLNIKKIVLSAEVFVSFQNYPLLIFLPKQYFRGFKLKNIQNKSCS